MKRIRIVLIAMVILVAAAIGIYFIAVNLSLIHI